MSLIGKKNREVTLGWLFPKAQEWVAKIVFKKYPGNLPNHIYAIVDARTNSLTADTLSMNMVARYMNSVLGIAIGGSKYQLKVVHQPVVKSRLETILGAQIQVVFPLELTIIEKDKVRRVIHIAYQLGPRTERLVLLTRQH